MPVTLTENVQDPLPAKVAPDRLTKVPPAVAEMVPPPQEPESPLLGEATVNPEGRVSVKPTPVRDVALFGFVNVKLRLVLALSAMVEAPKDLPIVGGATTVRVALPAVAVPPLVEVGVTLLTIDPAEVPFMLTVTEQLAPAATVLLVKLTFVVALAVPEHVLVRFDGDATAKPLGRVSVNATPVKVRLVFVLESVMVIVVVPFSAMLDGENDLASVGGLITVSVADAGELASPAAVESMVTLSE